MHPNIKKLLILLSLIVVPVVVHAQFFEQAATTGGGGGGSPGGSNTQVQYNNGGNFGGISGVVSNGTSVTISANNLRLTGASSGTSILNASSTGGGTNTLPAGTTTLAGLSTSQIFSGTNEFDNTVTVSGASLAVGGSQSVAAWTTSGVRYKGITGATTLNDTTSSGTVAAAYTNIFGGGTTITASNPVTFTRYIGSYFNVASAGSNVTFGQKFAIGGSAINVDGDSVASNPVIYISGSWFSGGTATTTKPHFLIEPPGVPSTAWNTNGTAIAANALTGFTGNLIDTQTNGVSQWRASGTGAVAQRGNLTLTVNGSEFQLRNGGTSVSSPASNSTQLGTADAAVPSAQTLRVQSVVAGTTDATGQIYTHIGSLGTGAANSGNYIIQTGTAGGTTGSSQHTPATVATFGPSSVLSSAGISALNITQTISNASATHDVLAVRMSNTSSGAAFLIQAYAGTTGTSSVFSISKAGAVLASSTITGSQVVSTSNTDSVGVGITGNAGTFFMRNGGTNWSSPGSNVFQLGLAAAATATDQTLQSQGSTGASSNGSMLTVSAGSASGTTAVSGGSLVLKAGDATGASGTRNGGNLILKAGTGGSIGGSIILQTAATTTLTTIISANSIGLIALPQITTDAGLTDATLCIDSTNNVIYKGSGVAGICLGTSSIRYKPYIVDLDVGLAEIIKLKPIKYKTDKLHGDPNKILYGFTAEQGGEVLPELMGKDIEGKPNTFDYLGVVPALVKAIQEQQQEIDALKRRIN